MSHRLFFALAGAIFAVDQLTKVVVDTRLPEGTSHPVVPGVLLLTHIRNPGTAFGLMRDSGPLLTVVTIAAVIFIICYWFAVRRQESPSRLLSLGLALPLGGALGNLVDRLRLGHVIDFIDFRVWPVFNVADTAITIGACLVAYYFFFVQDARAPLTAPPSAEYDTRPGGERSTSALDA